MSSAYAKQFSVEDYYGKGKGIERATVVESNEDALSVRISMIENAEKSIVLSTFDFLSDNSGKQMIASLKNAARRGVKVQILMDGFNGLLHMGGNPYFYALSAEENITIRFYNNINVLKPWKLLSRMHDKYLIADGKAYLLGGRNTFDYFLGDYSSYYNIDREVLVYNETGNGGSLSALKTYFETIWNSEYCKDWKDNSALLKLTSVRQAEKDLSEVYEKMKRAHGDWFSPIDYESVTYPTEKISLLSNPIHLYSKEPQVFYGLSELMKNADSEVVLHTPYFIGNDMMFDAFDEINKGTAQVTMMTNSAENNGNPFGAVDYVMNKERILSTGMDVLEYNGGVSYHGKSLTIDDDLTIVGSFNMDMKSVYHDTELMVVIDSGEVNRQLRDNFETYHESSQKATCKDSDMDALLAEGPMQERIQKSVLRILNPYFRFLM